MERTQRDAAISYEMQLTSLKEEVNWWGTLLLFLWMSQIINYYQWFSTFKYCSYKSCCQVDVLNIITWKSIRTRVRREYGLKWFWQVTHIKREYERLQRRHHRSNHDNQRKEAEDIELKRLSAKLEVSIFYYYHLLSQ